MTIEQLEPGDTIAYKTSHGWKVRTVHDDENIAQSADVILLEAGDTPTSAAVIIEHGELPYDPELRRPGITIEDCLAVQIGNDDGTRGYMVASPEPLALTPQQVADMTWREVSVVDTSAIRTLNDYDADFILNNTWGE